MADQTTTTPTTTDKDGELPWDEVDGVFLVSALDKRGVPVPHRRLFAKKCDHEYEDIATGRRSGNLCWRLASVRCTRCGRYVCGVHADGDGEYSDGPIVCDNCYNAQRREGTLGETQAQWDVLYQHAAEIAETASERVLELLIAWTDHTWTTLMVSLPADTDEDQLLELATDQVESAMKTNEERERIALTAIYADFGA